MVYDYDVKWDVQDKRNEYVAFRPYEGNIIRQDKNGKPYRVEIPAGAKFWASETLLWNDFWEPVCGLDSQNSIEHFVPNFDGEGMERGALTYAIAFETREHRLGFRLNTTEREWFMQKWSHYLRDTGTILFNREFYSAPVNVLREIADWLHIWFDIYRNHVLDLDLSLELLKKRKEE